MTANVQVYINDLLVDLVPGTVVAKTIQCFDLFSLGGVKANYTNQFKCLKTNNNHAIFQHANSVKSLTSYPYQPLPCRIIQNGIELIGNGSAVLQSVDDYYNIAVFDGTYNFFSAIQNKKLWDLNTSAYNKALVQDTDRTVTTGMVPAIYNNGGLTSAGGNITAVSKLTNSLYFRSLVDALFTTFGYSYSGAVTSLAKFQAMAIPLETRYQSVFATAKEFQASGGGQSISCGPLGTNQDVQFPNISYNGADGNYTASTYTVSGLSEAGGNAVFLANFQALLNITCNTLTTSGIGSASFKVQLELNGVLIYTAVTQAPPVAAATYQITVGATNMDSNASAISLKNGDVVRVEMYNTNTSLGSSTYTVNSGSFACKVPNQATDTNVPTGTPYLFANHLLPEMYLTDFVQFFANMFGLLFKESRGTIYMKNIDDLINDTGNAVDWTAKRDGTKVNTNELISYQFSSMAQSNTFKWMVGQSDTIVEDFAKGSFTIANTNLNPENVYTAPFAASRTELYTGIQMAQIPTVVTGSLTADVGTRIYLVRPNIAAEPTVNFGAGARGGSPNAYKIAYFLDGFQSGQMTWSSMMSNYTQYAIRMQKAKMVTRMYNLTDLDINNFDPFKLIYDDGAYFIVNSIYNYVPGKSTKVELFKI